MNLYKRIFKYPAYGATKAVGDGIANLGIGPWLLIAMVLLGWVRAFGPMLAERVRHFVEQF